MKKILLLSLMVVCALAFTSCENDEISVTEYGYAKRVFLEPNTTWGCTVTEVVTYMNTNAAKLSAADIKQRDVKSSDGTSSQKWILVFSGVNPYSSNNDNIEYEYCFNESNKDLKAVCVYLGGETNYIDINSQLEDDGYTQTGRDTKDKYYIYNNGKTQIKLYEVTSKRFYLRYQNLTDTEELTW